MTRRMWFALFTVLFAAVAVCAAADDAAIGTWKLDEGKSKLVAGMPKNTTVVYTVAGDSIKVVVEGIDAAGKATHNEWTGKFDGKDYSLKGDPTADARSYKRIDANTLELANKKGGKVVLSGRITISADGKTRTVTVSGTGSNGKQLTSSAVYNKQ
jgi:polyisoprenoid-binding protein YceI